MKKNNHYKAMAIAAILGTVPLQLMAQKLQVIKGEVDCGRTGYEMPVTATFELKNKGGRKMRINKVKMSCGCTQAHYPKGEIGSGDKFSVTLTYDARMLGHFEKSVALYTNATDKPVYLTMKGVVEADYVDYSKSYPYQIGDLRVDKRDLEFDDVNKGDSLSQELLIVNVGSRMLTPNLMHLPPYLSAQVMPEKLGGGKQGKILLTLHSSKLRDFGLTQTSIYLGNELGEKVSQDNEMVVSTVLLFAGWSISADETSGSASSCTAETGTDSSGYADSTTDSSLLIFSPLLSSSKFKFSLSHKSIFDNSFLLISTLSCCRI